jgi:tetratricopeptide (TPR) repeat protein
MKTALFSVFLAMNFIFLFPVSAAEELDDVVAEDEITAQKEQGELIIPENIDWTKRFIINEQKELRTDLEKLRREMMAEIHERELSLVDRALSYSANTVNFFFIFLTVTLMGLGFVGLKGLSDAKKSIRESMEKEVKNTVSNFQKKIRAIEQQQKVNVLWRQYYMSESNTEKIEILKKIEDITPESSTLLVERSNVYLEMESYEKVIELCNTVLELSFDSPQALYNRAYAHAALKDKKKAKEDLHHLVQLSADYAETIAQQKVFKGIQYE